MISNKFIVGGRYKFHAPLNSEKGIVEITSIDGKYIHYKVIEGMEDGSPDYFREDSILALFFKYIGG